MNARAPADPRRRLLAQQLDRVMRVWPIVGILLLVGNLSVQAATLLAWRGGHVVIWAAAIALVLVAGAVTVANWWAGPLRMVHAIRSSQATLDPTQVYAMTPWERIVWREAMLPQMRNQALLCRRLGHEDLCQDLLDQVERLAGWERRGYIPREEYPEDLQRYYLGNGGPL